MRWLMWWACAGCWTGCARRRCLPRRSMWAAVRALRSRDAAGAGAGDRGTAEGDPVVYGDIASELCTPTGAALLREIVCSFGTMPPMQVERIGRGYGTKKFDRPNCLQAYLGEAEEETVYEVCCNVDDMTGEEIAFARGRIEESGILDMTVLPAMMKKNRPGFLIQCLCREAQLPKTVELLLRHTTTGGVRYAPWKRTVLETSFETVETPYGTVRKKRYRGYGADKTKAEFEDTAAAAEKAGVPFRKVLESLEK